MKPQETQICPTCKRTLYYNESVFCVKSKCENATTLKPLSDAENRLLADLKRSLSDAMELQKQQPKNDKLANQIKCILDEISKIERKELVSKTIQQMTNERQNIEHSGFPQIY